MAEPFIFIATYTIKAGMLEDLRQFLRELFDVLEAKAPRALAVNASVNVEGTEMAIVQVHQDATSIREFWKVIHQHSGRELAQFVDAPTSTQVFGNPGDLGVARTKHAAESGAEVSAKTEHLGGFIRLPAAAK